MDRLSCECGVRGKACGGSQACARPRGSWTVSDGPANHGHAPAASGSARCLRLTAIFIAVCIVLIAASLGAVVYLVLRAVDGRNPRSSALAALDRARDLQHRLHPPARPRRCRRPDRRSVARHRRPRPPGGRDCAPHDAAEIEPSRWSARSRAMAQPLAGRDRRTRHPGEAARRDGRRARGRHRGAEAGRIAAAEAEPESEAETGLRCGVRGDRVRGCAGRERTDDGHAVRRRRSRSRSRTRPRRRTAARIGARRLFKGKSREEIAAFIRARRSTPTASIFICSRS